MREVRDPRRRRGLRHALIAVLMNAVIAVLAGSQNFREIGDEAADLPQEVLARVGARWSLRWRRFLAPSAAAIRRVICGLDAEHLDEVIYRWLRQRSGWDTREQQQQGLVALDGKTCTGASRPGDEVIADLAALRDQAELFGPVASDPTAWRVLSALDDAALGRLRQARAAERELVWAQLIETRGGLPSSTAAGVSVPGIVPDMDASIVVCHSEKQNGGDVEKTFGYHPGNNDVSRSFGREAPRSQPY